MKIRNFILSFLMLCIGTSVAQAQYYNKNARVVAQNYDISDNLDLQAVASIFGESRNLEDFERKLNDPSIQISNLDLNNDQYVDYLRVIEVADDEARIIVIQAVLGQDMFQDVATIELEKRNSRNSVTPTVYVQVVGNPYLYGPNYIYEPYYWYRPVFFDLLWTPGYNLYYSPWYWGYYPSYYSYWRPMPVFRYRRHITPVINTRNRYVYADRRNISSARNIYSGVSRNSYADRNPGRSFVDRNRQAINRRQLVNNRQEITRSLGNSVDRNTGRGIINSDRNVNTRNSNVRSTDLRSSRTRDFDSSRSRLIQDRSRDREMARDLKTRELGRIQRAEDSKREQVRIQRAELNTRRSQERAQAIERANQTRERSYNSRSNSSRNITRSTSAPSRSYSSPSRSVSTSSSRGSSSGRTISR